MNILKYLLLLHFFMIKVEMVQKNVEIIKYYEKRYDVSLDKIVVDYLIENLEYKIKI
ncbi:hypothetical protein [Clostridium sp. B9]|uniref:hypothetical protein n=1 Tax=Clostridium sp. B9 TaxID=3423224 RepID=UPI003D2F3D82